MAFIYMPVWVETEPMRRTAAEIRRNERGKALGELISTILYT